MSDSPAQCWICPGCGERIESDFDRCWQCGAAPDGSTDPAFESAVAPIAEQGECSECGYALRGIREDRCPECGAPFDRELRDTPLPAESKELAAHERTRRVWLRAWLVSWVLIPFSIAATAMAEAGDQQLQGAASALAIANLVVALGAPTICIILLLRRPT